MPDTTRDDESTPVRKAQDFWAFSHFASGMLRAYYLAEILRMKSQTLQYYMHDGPSAFRFELAGEIDNEGARELEQAWRTASAVIGDRALVIDMTFVTSVEKDAHSLLARWHAEGAHLIARTKASREIAEAIVGEPLSQIAANGNNRRERTWLPFHAFYAAPKLGVVLLLAAALFPVEVHAAHLKAETTAAWDDYVQTVTASLQDRVRPGGSFLWTYENPDRIANVHNGEIVVAPAPGSSPLRVPGGLIHHWVAGAFFPNVTINDVLEVTRDYDRYQQFYQPSVIASKALARENADDYFSMRLMNKAFFLKTTLNADYRSTNVRLDDRHFYSISRTTRVQEIEDYNQPREHRSPEGEGSGYIWRLFSVARMEERAEGVYVEMETVALSRDIPGAMRFVVDPIVRRVSRNSMVTSLRQTEEAVRIKHANSPSDAGNVSGASAPLRAKTSAFRAVQ